MSHQICPPCREAAAQQKAQIPAGELQLLGGPAHSPTICRDHAVRPHGCACQHGQHTATVGNRGQQ
jgi:hypothetical protein